VTSPHSKNGARIFRRHFSYLSALSAGTRAGRTRRVTRSQNPWRKKIPRARYSEISQNLTAQRPASTRSHASTPPVVNADATVTAPDLLLYPSGGVRRAVARTRERPSAHGGIGLRAAEPPMRRAAAIHCPPSPQNWCTRAAAKQPPEIANGARTLAPAPLSASLRRVTSTLRPLLPAPAARCEPGRRRVGRRFLVQHDREPYAGRPVPAGIRRPMITFSLMPRRSSVLPQIAASVSTLVVSWTRCDVALTVALLVEAAQGDAVRRCPAQGAAAVGQERDRACITESVVLVNIDKSSGRVTLRRPWGSPAWLGLRFRNTFGELRAFTGQLSGLVTAAPLSAGRWSRA
jgi:hypothetical protein